MASDPPLVDPAVITAFASVSTLGLGLFAFWYNFVGQSPIIETKPHSVRFLPGEEQMTVFVWFAVRNRRKHVLYVFNPEVSFVEPDLRVVGVESHSCKRGDRDLATGFSLSRNRVTVELHCELLPGQTVEFEGSFKVRGKPAPTLIDQINSDRPLVHAPRIYARIHEYTPRRTRYKISTIS